MTNECFNHLQTSLLHLFFHYFQSYPNVPHTTWKIFKCSYIIWHYGKFTIIVLSNNSWGRKQQKETANIGWSNVNTAYKLMSTTVLCRWVLLSSNLHPSSRFFSWYTPHPPIQLLPQNYNALQQFYSLNWRK